MNGQDSRFIFVTPYVDETKRIIEGCKSRNFKDPQATRGTKSDDLKRLLVEGANIASTHELFGRIDNETIELIRLGGYTLILDEVMDVVRQRSIGKDDLDMIRDRGLITVESNGAVVATDQDYRGKFDDFMLDAKMNRLIYVNGEMLMWQFPVNIFDAFDEVFVLTYLFDGQIQKYYYDFHGIEYQYRGIINEGERYDLTEADKDRRSAVDDRGFRKTLGSLINIYDGTLNTIGKAPNALSVTWYAKQAKTPLDLVRKNIYNYFRNKIRGKSRENMWTCFGAQKASLEGKGYITGHVACNARATNEYRDRCNLAYMINRYPRVPVEQYFKTRGITIDRETYALGELVQWVWRSRVRTGEPINLYIPSSRMRGLLVSWIESATAM
jgi:hypothetical protein